MRAKLILLLALLFTLTAGVVSTNQGLASALEQGDPQPIWGRATDQFYLELRLDQVREQLLLEVGFAPSHSAVFIEVQTTVYDPALNATTIVDYHNVVMAGLESTNLAVPIATSSQVTDYKVTAFAIHLDGTVSATEGWALLSRPVVLDGDLDATFPDLHRDLDLEMEASHTAISETSAIGLRFNWSGLSHAFVPSAPHSPLEFDITGPGTVYTALPMNSMRLSSGPAGVFTAN